MSCTAGGLPSPISKPKLRKGLWSPEENDKLIKYMMKNGQGCWSDVAMQAGKHLPTSTSLIRFKSFKGAQFQTGSFISWRTEDWRP
jgi:myb proto-oncogene protein